MRTTPFNSTAPVIEKTETVNAITFDDSVVDLSDRLKSKQAPVEEIEKEDIPQDEVKTDEPETETQSTESTDSAEFDEKGFEQFKEVASGKLGEFMDNPEQFTEILLKFGDLIRSFVYPSIYSKIIFNGQEKIDCEVMLRNRAKALMANEKYDFNNYELELWSKVEKLNEHKSKIPFSETEIKWLAKILSKRLESVSMAVVLEKYDWVLALLFIEGKRFLPVGQDRVVNLFFSNMNK